MPLFIDKILGKFGYKKKTNSFNKRVYNSAQISRLTNDWLTEGNIATDDILKWQLDIIRYRARDLLKNNLYIKGYVDRMKANVIGENGFTLQNKAITESKRTAKLINDEVENIWWAWCKSKVSIDGLSNFRDFCGQVLTSYLIDGEAFVYIIKNTNTNKYNYALQLLDTNLIDTSKNVENKNSYISLGIEKDKTTGKELAIYLKDFNGREIRIDANNVIHLYTQDFAGQTRGVSKIQNALIPLRMLAAYDEACLVAKRVAASKMGFIKMPNGEQYGVEDEQTNEVIDEVSAGMIEMLPAGADFVTFDPSEPKDDYANYKKSILMSIASGLGISYNALCNDYENVNFSSLRAAFLNERDYFKATQNWFVDNFVEIIFRDFISWCILKNHIKRVTFTNFETAINPTFICKRWDWVDPLKDVNARVTALNNNLTSLHKIIAEAGGDYDELMEEIAQEKEDMRNLLIGGNKDNGQKSANS